MVEHVNQIMQEVSRVSALLVTKASVVKFVSHTKNYFNYLVSIMIGADPCAPNPCRNNGICMASGTTFVCSCLTGFSGQYCEIRKYS